MSTQLPERPRLERLKNEAKDLLKRARKGDASAAKAIGELKLANAQLAIARQYGFASWSKLKRHIEGFDDRRDEFFSAIRAGDRERVARVLDGDPGIVRTRNPHSFGETPITAAANRDDRRMIDLLIERGADVNARSDWWAGSFGALDFASEETSAYLVKQGATLTAHAAARLGLVHELATIIGQNPDAVHERGGDGQYPLHFARSPEVVDLLVAAGADLDARDLDHESTAAQWRIKNREVLERLVHHGASTDIFIAVALDDPALIQTHLEADPLALTRKPNEPGNPMVHHQAPGSPIYVYELGFSRPLQVAANLDRPRAFEFLFEKSPPEARLTAACWKGDRELAIAYREHVTKLSGQDAAIVCDAARYRHWDQVALMLEMGIDVNAQDHERMTAIHWAGFHGDSVGIGVLLPYGPNLELQNVYGGTALSTLCYGSVNGWYREHDYAGAAELLIAGGAVVLDRIAGTPAVNKVLARHR